MEDRQEAGRVLKQYFGYDHFRPGQGEVIAQLLAGRDVLSVMPTGAGKSLCFQVPALCLPGVTLVVSPLISLMKDQVGALVQAGVPAAYINSSLSERQNAQVLQNARQGRYRLIYVAPERLDTPAFADFAQTAEISLLAVDEAHCISQWGQDFRPSYRGIATFAAALPRRPVIGAFTATATPEVRQDIALQLALQDPFAMVTGFDRQNLFFEVQAPQNKKEALLRFVAEHKQESGIVYCTTRANVEQVCALLCQQGIPATRYHAGLDAEERQQNQEAFSYGQAPVMVATNAFGMGIDKADVRYVVHFNMPKDIESYYQEAGRAGRDGDAAHCLLLYSGSDIMTAKFLIEKKNEEEPDPALASARVEADLKRLNVMARYCQTTGCLRQYILRYFGEDAAPCGCCGNCRQQFTELDVTEDAQKILSCVARTNQRFGAAMICDILHGANTERIQRMGLTSLSTYGLLAAMPRADVMERIRFLEDADALRRTEGEYPVLQLGPGARAVLFEGARLCMKVKEKPKAGTGRTRREKTARAGEEVTNPTLFEEMKALRTQLAKENQVPAYFIFSDRTLRELSAAVPHTMEALLDVPGIGQSKQQKFGQRFLEVIEAWQPPKA
ncbi:MAG: DNA helicase RecQ [Gemmiger sp.]|nr:DNA helicase RecQ [Gemmiger sp.]